MKPYMTDKAKVGDVITSPDFAYCVAAYDKVWNARRNRYVAKIDLKRLVVDGHKQKNHPIRFTAEIRDGRVIEDIMDIGCFDEERGTAEFVVERTAMDGGGTGHGPHDVYPDGWHVYARRLNHNRTYNPQAEQMDFYQSGSFNSVVGQVTVVGRMKQTFIWEKT